MALLPLLCQHSYFTLPFQYPDRPEVITDNLLKLTELAPDPCVHLIYISFHSCTLKRSGEGRRVKFIFKNLISKLHEFVSETKCVRLADRFSAADPEVKCASVTMRHPIDS